MQRVYLRFPCFFCRMSCIVPVSALARLASGYWNHGGRFSHSGWPGEKRIFRYVWLLCGDPSGAYSSVFLCISVDCQVSEYPWQTVWKCGQTCSKLFGTDSPDGDRESASGGVVYALTGNLFRSFLDLGICWNGGSGIHKLTDAVTDIEKTGRNCLTEQTIISRNYGSGHEQQEKGAACRIVGSNRSDINMGNVMRSMKREVKDKRGKEKWQKRSGLLTLERN